MDRWKGKRSEAVGRPEREASCEEEEEGRQEKGRKRMPACQNLVVMNVPAEILGRGVAEKVWRAKG